MALLRLSKKAFLRKKLKISRQSLKLKALRLQLNSLTFKRVLNQREKSAEIINLDCYAENQHTVLICFVRLDFKVYKKACQEATGLGYMNVRKL